jgi:hypothetical protein
LLEYAKLPLPTTFPNFDPDLEYPAELGVDGYLGPLSTAVSGRDQGVSALLNSPSHDTDFVLFSSSRKVAAVN